MISRVSLLCGSRTHSIDYVLVPGRFIYVLRRVVAEWGSSDQVGMRPGHFFELVPGDEVPLTLGFVGGCRRPIGTLHDQVLARCEMLGLTAHGLANPILSRSSGKSLARMTGWKPRSARLSAADSPTTERLDSTADTASPAHLQLPARCSPPVVLACRSQCMPNPDTCAHISLCGVEMSDPTAKLRRRETTDAAGNVARRGLERIR